MSKKNVLIWEITGIFFMIIVGSLLHFIFEWSGKLPIVGIFSTVNESVWEHLKLGFWSLLFFLLIEYKFIKNQINNLFFAKGLGILVLQGFILAVFYTYIIFTTEPILIVDILSYILGCILCQTVSFLILTKTNASKSLNALGLSFLIIHAFLLVLFTFAPPDLPIFQEFDS